MTFNNKTGGTITEEVAKNIYRIPVPLPGNPLKELNSYLIRDPERSILIDTGFRLPECKDALLAGLRDLGVRAGEFDVFLTHMHADHSGLSSEIIGDGGRILISEPDHDRLKFLRSKGDKGVWSTKHLILDGIPHELIDKMDFINPAIMYATPSLDAVVSIEDGETLRAGGYELRCVLTPGHSPGHMCLWDERVGLMFTGDHVLFDITPNITAWPTVEDSLSDYLSSLLMVREYPVKTALPGHRKTGDFHMRIDELIRHHEKRLAEVETIAGASPGLTTYEIAGRMRWKIRAVSWDDFPDSQKIFAIGECQSHIDYLRLRGRIKREVDGDVYRHFKR